jgi:hypothetical protein
MNGLEVIIPRINYSHLEVIHNIFSILYNLVENTEADVYGDFIESF